MSYRYNQLVIPFALWSGSVPVHNISCALFFGDEKIATGSETGVICLWSIRENQVTPEYLLIGHVSPITALVYDTFYSTESIVSSKFYHDGNTKFFFLFL